MPFFNLGSDLQVVQTVNTDPQGGYQFSKQILESYKKQGYEVRFEKDKPHTELVAVFSNKDGTRIKATVKLAPEGSRVRVTIQLTGKVHVGGLKGALATDKKAQTGEQKQEEEPDYRAARRPLPAERMAITHKFAVGGHEGYFTVGLYEDGNPGELFITMAKEGSTIGGLMDSLGTAISVALQYGVPTESLVHKFTHQRFEPAGMTDNKDIPFAKSLVDYIFMMPRRND